MQETSYHIEIFLIVVSLLILVMISFIMTIFYLYRKRQLHFTKSTQTLKEEYEKNLLSSKLEIQEDTFQNISREIHDNINLSLTLAKLHLNTFDWANQQQAYEKINRSIDLLTKSISDLSDISRSLNADVIIQQGLTKALEDELNRIRQAGVFKIDSILTGNPVYMDAQKELVIFRIVQEAFNNIIKHAHATRARLCLHYDMLKLYVAITDNGNGFDATTHKSFRNAGLKNMETRVKILRGKMNIYSLQGQGTTVSFTIPLGQNEN